MEGSLVAYKVFSNGSVLNASEINDNLMNQSVIVFSNSTARSAAIPTPIEGMVTYLTDTDAMVYWNGTAWIPIGGATGLNQVIPTSIVKGASGTATVGAGGLVTFNGTESISVNGVFDSTYDNYQVVFDETLSAAGTVRLRVRTSSDETGAVYDLQRGAFSGASAVASRASNSTNPPIAFNSFDRYSAIIEFFAPNKSQNTTYKILGTANDAGTTYAEFAACEVETTTQYTGFTIFADSGTMTGTMTIYGFRKGS